jgi:hypothetical protein
MDLATQCENASVRYYHKQNGDAFKYGPSWGFTNAEYYEQPFIGRHPA